MNSYSTHAHNDHLDPDRHDLQPDEPVHCGGCGQPINYQPAAWHHLDSDIDDSRICEEGGIAYPADEEDLSDD